MTGSDLESHLADHADHADEVAEADRTAVKSKSPTQLAMARFRKDKLSMAAAIVVLTYTLAAIAAPFLVWFGVIDPYTSNQDLTDSFGLPTGDWGGISGDHWLGVEPGIGRDTLARVWYGITFSLVIALTATFMAMFIGVVLGIVSGAAGGWVDTIIGRLIDLTLSFPQVLLLLALSSIAYEFITTVLNVPEGAVGWGFYVIVMLGLFGWTGIARIVRGQVLSIREREFVAAAQMAGASRFRVYFREILPNVWAPILVTFTLIMPVFVSAEAAFSFLGVSVPPPTPTLGNVLYDGLRYADTAPIYFFVPAIMIAIIVLSFNLLGDGLRDALDPKSDR
ncbi:ABC transporter permease [Nocardioides panacisoli]|uniref:ABC transporter permease n=1 Tax=Nocardioides panacisoli TaxID=627624 RepID=UPI001C62F2C1|nr:ABC transporter permease [Nocardioides panacisoli]QYJ05215.1 ABC transporter permease [Nocardioides panacisoli]